LVIYSVKFLLVIYSVKFLLVIYSVKFLLVIYRSTSRSILLVISVLLV